MLHITRYKNSRHWALYDGQELVAVTVYKRGAQEILRRLAAAPAALPSTQQPRRQPHGAQR
jgi:hypothetical protein